MKQANLCCSVLPKLSPTKDGWRGDEECVDPDEQHRQNRRDICRQRKLSVLKIIPNILISFIPRWLIMNVLLKVFFGA